jgi:ribosomal protein L18
MPWYIKTPMPTARNVLAAFAISGIGYAVGGQTSSGLTTANQGYDPSTDTWSNKDPMPTPREFLAGFAISGIGYAVGGQTSSSLIAYNEAYNPSTNTWSTKASMPTARAGFATFVISGIGYAVGGFTSSGATSANEAYNPSTNTWSTKASMPTARGFLAGFAISGIGYAVGGELQSGGSTSANEAYNPSTNTWSTKASMSTARIAFAAFAISGIGYAVGGYTGPVLAINEAYNPSTNTWSTKDSMPTARGYLAGFVIDDIGYGYAVGGSTTTEPYYLNTNEAFTPFILREAGATLAGASSSTTRVARLGVHRATSSSRAVCTVYGAKIANGRIQSSGRSSTFVRLPGPIYAGALSTGLSTVTSRVNRVVSGSTVYTNRTTDITLRAGFLIVLNLLLNGVTRATTLSTRNRIGSILTIGISRLTVVPTPPLPPLGPLRLEAAHGSGFVSVYPVLSASYTWRLGELGELSVSVPVTAANIDALDVGKLVRLIRQGEGIVFAGYFSSKRTVLEGDGPVVELSGYGLARELSLQTTKISWIVDGQPTGSTVSTLLLPGWTASVEKATELVTAIFEGATRFEAISKIAQQKLMHLRPEADTKSLTLFSTITASPFRLLLYPSVPPYLDPTSIPIQKIRITRRDEEVVNRIIPLGAGEGVNVLDLRWSDRTSPYPIRSGTTPTGTRYYYIEDDSSIATYGLRERVMAFKNVAPIANSPAAYREAANTLYELAVAWLNEHKEPRTEWEVSVLGPVRLRDPLTGAWYIRPGQTVHLLAKGVAEDVDGKRVIVDLDTTAFVRGIKRNFRGDVEEIDFELSSDTEPERGEDALSEVVERLWALSVHQKHITFERQNGPLRRSIDDTHPVVVTVRYDPEIRFLHRVMVHITCHPLRSNVQVAAAGGGQTTTASGSHSHSINAYTTEAGGGGTSTSDVVGNLIWARTMNNETWSDPGRREQVVSYGSSAGVDYGMYVGRGATTPTNANLFAQEHYHNVSLPSHSHSVSGQTTTAATPHSHSVSDHTHALVYGIYESTLPSTKQIRIFINGVDRTSALGGPWDATELNLDITQFLQTQFLTPVQQNNQIELRVGAAGARFDVEVTVRSIITMSSVVPL